MVPEPFTFIPDDQRSIALPDSSITSSFLEMFGRPARDSGLQGERSSAPTADQRLYLLNSSHIQSKIENGPKLRALLGTGPDASRGSSRSDKYNRPSKRDKFTKASNRRKNPDDDKPAEAPDDSATIRTLYLTILSRFPTQEELKTVNEYAQNATSKREAAIDLAWALINGPEFLYRH
jgi:hypothetical protein